MTAKKRPKRSMSAQNKIYFTVVGVSLVLIVVLVIVLVTKVNQNRPDPTESNSESQNFTEDVDPTISDTDPLDTSNTEPGTVTGTAPIETPVVTDPPEGTDKPTATTEGGASINTLPPQTTAPPAQTTAAPTTPENIIDEITLPLGFGHIDADNEVYVNDTAVNSQYEGEYSGIIEYRHKNLDKLSLSGSTKNKVDRIIALSASAAQDLYGNLSGDKLSLLSDSYPLSSNGTFSVTMAPKKGVTEYKNVTPVIFGSTANLRVYYLAEGIISYVYSESYQADLSPPSTLAWFEIRGEIYPD